MPSGTPRDNAAPVPPVAIPATMRAVVAERYGGIEALRVTERQRPDIASDEVLVQVYAAGLDRGQLHLLNGEPYLLRLALGLRRAVTPTRDIGPVIDAIHAQGGLVIAAHPTRRFWPTLVPVRHRLDGAELMEEARKALQLGEMKVAAKASQLSLIHI